MKLFAGEKILKIVKYFQLILFLLCFQPAVAESLDQQKTAERFIENIKGIKSYQADFEQKVHNEMGAEVDYSSGKFYIQNTNHFRWEVEEVFPQLIIGNGKYIYTYDPELEQVTIQNQGQTLEDSPLLLLTSTAEKLLASYHVTILIDQKKKGQLLFELKPKAEGSVFESVHVLFSKGKISELLMKDSMGQQTTVTFQKVKMNESLNSRLFIFTPPEGVDIIDSRERLLEESP